MKRSQLLAIFLFLLIFAFSQGWFQKLQLAVFPVIVSDLSQQVMPLKYERRCLDNSKHDFRLKPDRRFLLAVADIHGFLSGEEKAIASAEYAKGKWSVLYKGEVVGILPEYADFNEMMLVLADWARVTVKAFPLFWSENDAEENGGDVSLTAPGGIFAAPDLFGDLAALETSWRGGARHLADLSRIAHELVLLAFQSLDTIEIADALPARALAMTVIAKVLAGADHTRDDVLLAYLMGYRASARQLARELEDDEALKFYILRDDAVLSELAGSEAAGDFSRYLWLLRLSKNVRRDERVSWIKKHFTSKSLRWPALKVVVSTGDVVEDLSAAYYLLHEIAGGKTPELPVFLSDEKEKRPHGLAKKIDTSIRNKPLFSLIRGFEEGLRNKHLTDDAGPFLDLEIEETFYRGIFYSSLYAFGGRLLDDAAVRKQAPRFNKGLDPSQTDIAGDFSLWYRALSEYKKGRIADDIFVHLLSFDYIGLPPLYRSYLALRAHAGDGSAVMVKAARMLARHMDSRLSHRRVLGDIAIHDLKDEKLASKLGAPLHGYGL